MAKSKKKLVLFIIGFLVVAFFSWRLFYFRQLGLAQEFPPGVKFNKVIFYPDDKLAIGIYKTVSDEI